VLFQQNCAVFEPNFGVFRLDTGVFEALIAVFRPGFGVIEADTGLKLVLKEFLSTNEHELLRIKTEFLAEFRIYSCNSLTLFLKFMMLRVAPYALTLLFLTTEFTEFHGGKMIFVSKTPCCSVYSVVLLMNGSVLPVRGCPAVLHNKKKQHQ
jgi:hypothetical protein